MTATRRALAARVAAAAQQVYEAGEAALQAGAFDISGPLFGAYRIMDAINADLMSTWLEDDEQIRGQLRFHEDWPAEDLPF